MLKKKNKTSQTTRRRPRVYVRIILIVLAGVLFSSGLILIRDHQQTITAPAEPLQGDTVIVEDDTEPSEVKPDTTEFVVGKHEPRKIVLPSLHTEGYIQKVGINKKGNMSVPTNVHVAGWYVGSTLPGERGVSIINGHVLGRFSDAVFVNLHKLKIGDLIRVQKGDLSWVNFEAVEILSLGVDETTLAMDDQLEGVENQLTLITCDGQYDDESHTYDKRIIVRAQLTTLSL